MNKLIIFDTTLRDGEQTPGVSLNIAEKREIARQLEKLGVDIIEAGFAASSPGDLEAIREIAAFSNCAVASLARCVKADIDKAWEALKDAKKPRLHLVLATSPIHIQYKLRMTEDEVYQHIVESVAYAKTLCEDVQFSPEDCTRSDRKFIKRALTGAIEAGATTINIPDTVGYSMPNEFADLIRFVRDEIVRDSGVVISVHCHNDLGLAVANSLAALQNGALQVEGTINGLGERAGNAALEEIIMSVETRPGQFPMTHSVNLERIFRCSRTVANLTSVEVPICKAIVGDNAFRHESGIHQHGMMTNSETYEIMSPATIGRIEDSIVLGKHSGRHAFFERLAELGYQLTPQQQENAFARFKELADRKKQITDRDLEKLLGHGVGVVERSYALESFQLQSGSHMKSISAVSLKKSDGTSIMEAAVGDGPIYASFKAIERITQSTYPLASYNIRAVTEGEDALGEVTVRVAVGPKIFTGKGLASDIIEASIRAYINAINRALAER